MKSLIWSIAAAIGLASPAFAYAYATEAYVTGDIDLLAGPDQEYPLIDHLEEGSNVSIQGCTPGWEWCDVVAYGERGWVPGSFLEIQYQDQWVLVPDYAPNYGIGIPVVVFSIRNYWDTYYRYRPFYYQRWEWYRRPIPHRPYPVDFPPPHPFHGPPPVHHHPIDYPPPFHHHPTPPPRVVPMPHPTPNPTPPPRVAPMPHPTPNPTPPPRVAPIANPHVMPQKPAPASSKQNDQGGH